MCVMSFTVYKKKKKKKKKKRRWTNREFRRFAYKACTGLYSYLKHANS